jgi:hypothetical protein
MRPEAENRTDQRSVLDLVLPALERAAQKAREEALAHSTDLIVWQNNQVRRISPKEIREQAAQYTVKKIRD